MEVDGRNVVVYLNLVPAKQQNIVHDLETASIIDRGRFSIINSLILLKSLCYSSNQIHVPHTVYPENLAKN